jgi:hypothetical protein
MCTVKRVLLQPPQNEANPTPALIWYRYSLIPVNCSVVCKTLCSEQKFNHVVSNYLILFQV